MNANETLLARYVRAFFELLDKTESTDDGREFKPNRFSSCRASDAMEMEHLLKGMEGLSKK